MAIVSHRIGYLFLHTPRTGGSALTRGVLIPRLDGSRLPPKPIEVPKPNGGTRRVGQHISLGDLLGTQLLTSDEVARLFTFTTARNPFDSLVSSYVKKRDVLSDEAWTRQARARRQIELARETSFPEFVERNYAGKRPRHMSQHVDDVEFVMHFERLQSDFDVVCARLGVAPVPIPRLNETPRPREYRSYYTPEARTIVETAFAPDLERFGYEF